MRTRQLWIDRLEAAWRRKSVVWLHGVRRVGKTVLCRSLPGVEYFDCELPKVRQTMQDPEGFLDSLRGRRIALDEIHRLPAPSELLKIAADHYPDVLVIATGSSTLGTMARVRDTLAGRKADVRLPPMVEADRRDLGGGDLDRRMSRGGLPGFYLAEAAPGADYAEWLDAYWARDVQEMFRVGRRSGFLQLLELCLVRSGGIFEASAFAGPCEISRPSVTNYLSVLEATGVVTVVRPYSSRRSAEIISAPRVYGFDTGFVCFARGWDALRPEDRGVLFEHLVLNELLAAAVPLEVRYWRDKRGHEVDFVLPRRGGAPVALECKWRAGAFDPSGLAAFRRAYPGGVNLVVAGDVDRGFAVKTGGLSIEYVGLPGLLSRLGAT